ncbi:MAG: DUF1858 domain-containing protein [Nitrospinales bacterium]
MMIQSSAKINEIIHQYPQTAKFFSDLNMSCSGCFAMNFDTLEKGALMHGMDVDALVQKLNQFISDLPPSSVPSTSQSE